ncbi:hypothetical protein B296_00036211 [Ensete ventricosum]|uniref:Uncharacterized protein n=1 Tax=Ensete ventricosum TaxID=4639 RepID=A0A426Y5H2_ENSVE|nr:hypothetical protein B296_00036211 [Ensete ventricosum]
MRTSDGEAKSSLASSGCRTPLPNSTTTAPSYQMQDELFNAPHWAYISKSGSRGSRAGHGSHNQSLHRRFNCSPHYGARWNFE